MTQTKKTRIDVIGSVELLDFPEAGIRAVPARVDTGAIFSSVWASEIKMNNGVLSFKLFAPGSALYNGQAIETKNFRTSSIKNSFGQSEFRYKVRLQVGIGGRKIRAWFTLADRAGMTYPVLLGRNILRSKFVVDVSQRKTRSTEHGQVLVLASEGHEFDEYFAEVSGFSKKKTNYTVRDYKDLAFSIAPGQISVQDTLTGRNIDEFDLIYFKSHKRDYPLAIAAAQYAQARGVKVVDEELLSHISYDKLSENMRLALHDIPVPFTFHASTDYILKNIAAVAKNTGWPLVCKEIEEDKGRKNYIFDNAEELKAVLEKADRTDRYIIQKYVPNEGFIRALVLDREVGMAIYRSPIQREEKLKRHLNKLHGAENVFLLDLAELDSQVQDLSIRASVLMNRQVAGVDIIQNSDSKEWFILEVNSAPQIKSGPFLDQRKKAVAAFIDRELYS